MLKLDENKAYIETIRALDSRLERARLVGVTVKKEEKEVRYDFICDKAVDDELKQKMIDASLDITPQCFAFISVNVYKVVSDKDTVLKAIKEFLNRGYTSLAYLLDDGDIEITMGGENIRFTLKVIESSVEYIKKNGVLDKITQHLQTKFCDNFVGEVAIKAGEIDKSVLKDIDENISVEKIERRVIKVLEVVPIDEKENPTDLATYIEDAKLAGSMTLSGRITDIREKTTKSGKPMYIIDFSDTTSKASGIYFTRKTSVDKIKELKIGDGIIAQCTQDYYNDRLSLKLDKINRCTFPPNFVPQRKGRKPLPEKYTLIFPEKDNYVKEVSLLDPTETLPECILNNEFTVIDLETTGTNPVDDRITEIGAVRVKGGRIVETFTTLVNPGIAIPQEVVKLTGITDDMVKGAPGFEEVVGDLYKFSNSSILCGHNFDGFDIKFIRNAADKIGYYFDARTLDTYPMSVQLLHGLSNNKLNTVAEYFHIEFHHHRALSDAYATAEVLIELLKIKKCL